MTNTSETNLSQPFQNMLTLPPPSIKLDRDNYYLWQSTTLSALEAYELEGYVNGKISA